ncbi:MAG: PatB family C-S lyase [Bacteroidota bacterium]
MSSFDIKKENVEHRFAKHNPHMLKNMFGSDDLTPFWIADMDFPIAEPITKELQRLVDRGVYAYEFAADSVFNAIIDWNNDRHALALERQSFVQITGVLTGISLLIRELTQVGDGILIQTPVYHQFPRLIKASNRRIVRNPLRIVEGEYRMDFIDLEKKLQSENVKIILLCNPHNPIGRVWNQEELQQLVALAEAYELRIISDEIHADIIYPGHKFNSILSMPESRHIALLGSPAKTFGMQSIANGYLYIREETIRKHIKDIVEGMYLDHGNAFTTFGTIAAYQHGGPWVDELIAYLGETIQWIRSYLHKEFPMIKMYPVEGTYQIWLDFREMNLDSEELNSLLIDKARLALTPGSWFGKESSLFMRMNIASPLSSIQQAFEQLKQAYDGRV